MDEYEITSDHYELYQKYVHEWLDIFKINDYSIHFVQETDDDKYAWCMWKIEDRICVFGISTYWDTVPSDEFVCKIAFHEVWELLLGELHSLAECRFVQEREIETAVHSIIRRMENTVFNKYRCT